MSVSSVNSNSNPVQTNNNQSASSTSSDSSLQSIESTFLTLLVQELQNQDPTAPMDSTQMVGQMISLNQLDQLASINQVVTNALGSSQASVPAGSSGS
jgi:flagellar basal-body rod modification protein FlgD